MRFCLFAAALLALALAAGHAQAQIYRFGLVPKTMSSPYFDLARDGCVKRAKELGNVECIYLGPTVDGPATQLSAVQTLLGRGIDGLAISAADALAGGRAIREARAAGIPVITFDADALESERQAYVGTDNRAFGRELAEQLKRLRPSGGTYGVVTGGPAANLEDRLAGLREGLAGTTWREVPGSPLAGEEEPVAALQRMAALRAAHPDIDAIVPLGAWPMLAPEAYRAFVEANRADYDAGQLSLVAADALKVQLDLLKAGYVNVLVGQHPHEMGERAMDLLLALRQGRSVPQITYSGLDVVTRENVDRLLKAPPP